MSSTKLEYLSIQPRHELLPVELIAAIIDIVADGYRDSLATQREPLIFSTLAAASLVSRTWNTICRAYIFRTIKITAPGDPGAQFSFLHFEAPHLSRHIHKLNLKWDGRCTADDWLADCFRQMKNLRELRLQGGVETVCNQGSLLSGPYAPPGGMKPMLAAPCLRRLVLCGWYFAEDGSDLVGMLPDTIEELVLEVIGPPPRHAFSNTVANVNGSTSSGRRLEYLRSMDLLYIRHPLFDLQTFIECPNLRRFAVGWAGSRRRWDLPPWIPTNLLELELETDLDSYIPRINASIQPSVVKIEVCDHKRSSVSFRTFIARIKACIDRLSSPHLIQTLTINIVDYEVHARNRLYSRLSDYEALSQFLQQLRGCKGGKLKAVFLNIKMGLPPKHWSRNRDEGARDENELADDSMMHVDEARETAKMEKGFAELLKDNILNVEFTIERLSLWPWGGSSEALMHCSIRTM
ncbi:hypothetical protein AB1N83_007867 [Pleurotus pulmonarius]